VAGGTPAPKRKTVNDTWGHAAGDELLVAFAASLGSCVRDFDLLARMGGDEFAVLMPTTTTDQARSVIERARTTAQEDVEPARFSAGIVQMEGPDETLEALLKRADQALYEAKEAGRNRTVVTS
jgi:two-component system cell cycle response regulator